MICSQILCDFILVQRTVYKDLLCLLTSGDLLQNRHLKAKVKLLGMYSEHSTPALLTTI